MKRMWLAAILASTAAIAVPVFAQSAGTDTQQTQAAMPAQQGDEQGGTGDAMQGTGRWGMHGWMARRDIWRRGMMRGDAQQWCIDRLARRAARRAYVETKLDLTAQQRPLWDKLQTIAQGEVQRERALCQQLKPGQQTTIIDRMNRAQEFLSVRLDALQSAKPALQALYQALTPDQRAIMDRPFSRQ